MAENLATMKLEPEEVLPELDAANGRERTSDVQLRRLPVVAAAR